MGYVLIEYMIFEGNEKLLTKLRTKIINILKKESDLSEDLVGQVHLGANGHNSLIVHPHGWNGGWCSYSDTKDEIMDAFYAVNHQEHQRYLKSKNENDYEHSIFLTTYSHGDSGHKLEIEHLAEDLKSGCNPDIGFIYNDRYMATVKAVDDETAAHMEKMGTEEWERKQERIARKLVELEELGTKKKKTKAKE